ncbi:MAG: flap endonuclease-1 [Methanobrevibacter sp.]|nr:flap endonuclease-1 [Candidatus Methanovirga basalitermitum]
MGVKIKDLLTIDSINLKDLNGKTIAIDAANIIYQFLSSIRQEDGSPLVNKEGNTTSHLSGILYRTSSIVEKGIKPIYVFDGKPSHLKEETISKRKKIKEESEKKWKKALEEGDTDTARKYAIRTSRMSTYVIESSKKLLDLMGVPHVQACGEGEAQATYMVRKGDVWAVASQDYDCLLFGAPRIVRNLTLNRKRLEFIELKKVLIELGLSRKELIDVSLMIGTDFNPGIKGIGSKTGVKIIKSQSLEDYLKESGKDLGRNIYQLRDLFLNHDVNENYKIKWKNVNEEKLLEFMCDENGFSMDRISTAIKKMKKSKTIQRSLEDWF